MVDISEEIIDVIDALCEKLGIAIDWTAENILPYLKTLCEKFIKFEIATSIFWIAFMASLCGIFWLITLCAYRRAIKSEWDDEYASTYIAFGGFIVSGILSFITIIVVGVQVYDIIEAINFPEKVIYDYISGKIATMRG